MTELAIPFSSASAEMNQSARKAEIMDKGLEVACGHDTSSPMNKAVFFSGANEKRAATDFCRKNNGYIHVCMTPALQAFDALNLFKSPLTIREIYDLGDLISERFAQEASGNVTIFIGNKCKAQGTFLRVELPTLMQNPKVTSINGNPKTEYEYLLKGQDQPRVAIHCPPKPPVFAQ